MYHTTISVRTHGEGEIVNLSPRVEQAVAESGIQEGLVSVFVTGSTAAVTTIEYEPGVLADLRRALSVIAPADISYAHDAAWGDGNGRSHVPGGRRKARLRHLAADRPPGARRPVEPREDGTCHRARLNTAKWENDNSGSLKAYAGRGATSAATPEVALSSAGIVQE